MIIKFACPFLPFCCPMKLLPILLSLAVGAGSLASGSAQAMPVELRVLKTLDRSPANQRCPDKITVDEELAPYREGSYTINGQAKLGAIADPFTLATSDDFSATWVAPLKPAYAQCKATAGIAKLRNEPYQGVTYLRSRLVGGKIYLILDMTGMGDANQFTPNIFKKAVQAGNPTWSWGGSD
jgi:hypothetical protein